MRRCQIYFLAVLAVQALFVPSPASAQSPSSAFETSLATEKSSYKLTETVYAQQILYNPTAQRIVVHFTGGCWYDLVIRDMLGTLVHNETRPACDPDINGYKNTTNLMTVDPGGGRWFSTSWSQLDGLGKHVPVPADYVLSWSFKNPDRSIPEASTRITLTDQVQTQLDSFSATAFRFFQILGPSLVWIPFVGTILPWSRAIKGTRRSTSLMITLPLLVSGITTMVIIFAFYSKQLVCMAIQCPGTISLVNTMNIYLLITPLIWGALFLVGKMVREEVMWLPFVIFGSWTFSALSIAFSVLSSMNRLWMNTFYYDWTIVWPSYALFVSSIPAQLIFYRVFRQKLLATAPFATSSQERDAIFNGPDTL